MTLVDPQRQEGAARPALEVRLGARRATLLDAGRLTSRALPLLLSLLLSGGVDGGAAATSGHSGDPASAPVATASPDTVPSDSPVADHAARLDSLRERVAALRGSLLRLRLEHGARIERLRAGLSIQVPLRLHEGRAVGAGRDALHGVASVALRYFPDATVDVTGAGADPRVSCGTRAARRRARAAIRYLTGEAGLDGGRVRRGDCGDPDRRADSLTAAAPGSASASPAVRVLIRTGGA